MMDLTFSLGHSFLCITHIFSIVIISFTYKQKLLLMRGSIVYVGGKFYYCDAKIKIYLFLPLTPYVSHFFDNVYICLGLMSKFVIKSLFSFFNRNSHVEFARRGANNVVHSLVGVVLLSVSPQNYYDVSTYISDLIIIEMH